MRSERLRSAGEIFGEFHVKFSRVVGSGGQHMDERESGGFEYRFDLIVTRLSSRFRMRRFVQLNRDDGLQCRAIANEEID